jgi:hypothetical protein
MADYPCVRRILPWLSLGLGIFSAIWMDRRPERAPIVAIAAAGGWLLLSIASVLQSVRSKKLVARAARWGAALGSQSLVQMSLFFSAPFFYRAASIPAHWAFVGVIGVAGLVTLWAPLSDAAMRHSIFGSALQAIATFAGLDCVLPLLGFSTQMSLWIAIGWTAGGLLLIALVRRSGLYAALLVAAALVIGMYEGGARFVPPAPLRFVEGQMGTHVTERKLTGGAASFASPPEQLVCYTKIVAPRGLTDHLRHVWRQNGAWRTEIMLEIRGGRHDGFRTWSTFRSVTPGKWTCTIETESGQRVGRVTARVGP